MKTGSRWTIRGATPPVGLHVLGLVTLFAAVAGVNSVYASGGFVLGVMLLACAGHMLSMYLRSRGISSRLLELTVFGICVATYARTMLTPYDIGDFGAGSMDSPQIRFAALLAWVEAFRCLTLSSNEAVLFTAVPSLAIIGLAATDNVNPDIMAYFLLYLFCVSAMLGQCVRLKVGGGVQASAPAGAGRFRSAVIVAVLAFCVGGLIAWPVRFAAIKTLRGSAEQFGGGGALAALTFAYSTSSVSVLGGPVRAGNMEVLTVRAPGALYLRGNVFDIYTGQAWQRSNRYFREQTARLTTPWSGRRIVQEMTVRGGSPTELVGAADPIWIEIRHDPHTRAGKPLADSNCCWITQYEQPPLFAYRVISISPQNGPGALAADRAPHPAWVLKRYLQTANLDPGKPSRTRLLAEKVTRGCSNAYEKALAIEGFLSESYTYDPLVRAAPSGEDAVEYFLFKSRRGYCTALASAMAIMLRELGIPARLATGFAPGDYDSTAGVYRVRARDRHAWVEVYFPSYGWVTFDPSGSEETHQPGFWAVLTDETRQTFRRLLTDRPWIILLVMLSLTVMYLVRPDLASRTVKLTARPVRRDAAFRLAREYDAMCRVAARAGVVRASDQTPSEYAAVLGRKCGPDSPAAAVAEGITRTFERARYGGESVDEDVVRTTRINVRRLRMLLRRDRCQTTS